MLNVPVPYTAPATPQSMKYNYPPSRSPSSSRRTSQDRPRSSFSAETDHYFQLADPIDAPPVIVFFSFLDKRSQEWALDHQVAANIRKNVSQGTTVSRYHVQTSDEFSQTLTQSWAVANVLQVDDRIIGPMFQAVQSKRVVDLEGVREVFDGVGVPPDMLAKEFMTQKTLMEKKRMTDAVESLELKNVPAILVRGKYLVKLDSYGEFDMDGVVEMVKILLARSD